MLLMQHLFYCKIILDQARIFPVADKKTQKNFLLSFLISFLILQTVLTAL
ncbi:hypothetical protein RUMTOR_01945 [[Ruminococcus] torques ATCC 27756]|uniref:Uncharacterized protein n=1 Tax=[Ruminococcus] torques ATCC 27756 TaxID=411460 RepID=A5KNW8_9FIRM|nr:hypothetical protein RUMTOR_01945 [[Ruminococcus] torques ATCC 27756]